MDNANGHHKIEAPRSVLIYSLSWLPGQVDGIAVRMLAQVKELASRGVKVTLVTPNYELPGHPLHQDSGKSKHLRIPGVEHILLDTMPMPVYEKNMCAALTWRNYFTVVSILRRVKPDLVHHTQCVSLHLFNLACVVCDVPLLCSMHTDVTQIAARDDGFSSELGGRRAAILSFLAVFFVNLGYRLGSILGVSFFSVSPAAKTILANSGVPMSSVAEVAWGPMADRETFRIELPEADIEATRNRLTMGLTDVFLMVYVGRITAEKDVQFLVDALERAPKNVVLALVGNGSMAAELSKRHGQANRLYCTREFVGREEVALVLRAADCCVSASVMETVGFTAMEALSCGTPMLAANAQGFADHLNHGVNARLFTPNDPQSFDDELAVVMATRRTGDWSPESLRMSMEHASLSTCTDRSLQAYAFASRRPRRNLFRFAGAAGLLVFNIALFKVPAIFRATTIVA